MPNVCAGPFGAFYDFYIERPWQDVRYLAVDLSPKMLRRAERRARAQSLQQVELLEADITELPFADAEVDLLLSYSGTRCLPAARACALGSKRPASSSRQSGRRPALPLSAAVRARVELTRIGPKPAR